MANEPFFEEGSRLLTPPALDVVLTSELKRAVRSPCFLTLVVLGSEAPIVQELKFPSSTSAPRPTAPPLQPVMPPPAAAAAPVSPAAYAASAPAMAGAGAMMSGAPVAIGIDSVAAVAAPAGASAAANVSLKDIARTAAREAERELILRMLTRTRWNRKEAAEILGISYKALLYKIKENGLDKAS